VLSKYVIVVGCQQCGVRTSDEQFGGNACMVECYRAVYDDRNSQHGHSGGSAD